MRRIVLALAVLVLATPAWAQVKVKRCLNKNQLLTEQIVRHGVFLREGGRRCDEYKSGTAKMWTDFDTRFGARLARETDKRKKFFAKEFKAKAEEVTTYFDGRMVTYARHIPLGIAYCEGIHTLLTDANKKGWGEFSKQASVIQNEVMLDYKICK